MSSSFVDTNVPIAYVFSIEPKNQIAEFILTQEYDNVYCSENVLLEFDYRVQEKKGNLLEFYNDLILNLSSNNDNRISIQIIKNFAKNKQYSDDKTKKDVISSIDDFWYYFNPYSTFCSKDLLIEFINQFINELENGVSDRFDFCEDNLINIDDGLHNRTNQYNGSGDLFGKLCSCRMHDEDIEITLDAHDYNLTRHCELDFITFDKVCYKCVSQENLCFNQVKCYKDYENT